MKDLARHSSREEDLAFREGAPSDSSVSEVAVARIMNSGKTKKLAQKRPAARIRESADHVTPSNSRGEASLEETVWFLASLRKDTARFHRICIDRDKMKVLLLLTFLVLSSGALSKDLPQDNDLDHEKDQLDLIEEDESLNEIELDGEENETPVKGGYVKDPCLKVRCGAGRVCEVNDQGEGQCVCIQECPQETDDRRKACSNHNETWSSDCEIYRMRCFCTEDSEECQSKKYKHVHVDYYGECRDIPKCSEEEMEDFPRRMREWLFNVMQDLAQRRELDEPYLQMEQEAERELAKKWSNAVIWKFCDLDSHPFDRSVSRHELFPIRAPLLAMEHCIAPFLDKCDVDDDHRISLKEWGLCLGLEENEIEDKCADIRDNSE